MALLETISGPLAKAYVVNHPAATFDVVTPFYSYPIAVATTQPSTEKDGVWNLSAGRPVTCNWLLVIPYGDGQPGDQFSMRMWGVRRFGNDSGPDVVIWIPYVLCEVLCTICNQPGPQGPLAFGNPTRFLLPTENLCDTITLTHGIAGITTLVNSPGSDAMPGSNLTASVLQEMYGSEEVYFDFQNENGSTCSMNAAFAKA